VAALILGIVVLFVTGIIGAPAAAGWSMAAVASLS
jgi:hypothetical protein